MKKLFALAFGSMLLASTMAVSTFAAGEEMAIAYGTPTIDAEIDEIWASADRQELTYVKAGDSKGLEDPDCKVYASALWDETSLYFLFEIEDNEFAFDSTVGDWKNDSIYLYLDEPYVFDSTWVDGQCQTAFIPCEEYSMVPRKGQAPKSYEMQYTFPSETTCIIEVKYETSMLELVKGTLFGLDFQYNDCTEGAIRPFCLGWCDETDNASNSSTCWGEAVLLEKGVAVPTRTESEEAPVEEAPAATEEAPAIEEAPAEETPVENAVTETVEAVEEKVDEVVEAVTDAAEKTTEAVTGAVEEAKSNTGVIIGVVVAVVVVAAIVCGVVVAKKKK